MNRILALAHTAARSTAQKFFGLPQGFAFLPACTLGAFWIGGETALIFAALLVPLAYALAGQDGGRAQGPSQPRDAATGLLLRDAAVASLDHSLSGTAGSRRPTAGVVIFIEGLGEVAQRFGLPAVDTVLHNLGERFCSALRQDDIVTRAEGNCFAIALSPLRRADLETLLQIAGRLQEAAREPISIDATSAHVTSSIGFCLSTRNPGNNGESLMKAAETAMLNARQHGPGAIRAFSSDMQAAVTRRTDMIDEMVEALDTGQIRPWFQPQISTDTGAVTGFEALARWKHPRLGLVPPDQFLHAIEQAGLSDRLSEEILFQSLSALRSWDVADINVPSIGVNFSSDELRNPRLVDRIAWELDRFGLTPDRLNIEVLETVMYSNTDDAVAANIGALSKLGCGIDLDDFGTGQASIGAIRRFKVRRLKIDRSFVTNLDNDSEQRDMMAAILTMAERLKLETLAEGVETVGEHSVLSQMGCSHVQGFGIARPMPFEDTIAWVTQHQKKITKIDTLRRHTG